MYSGIQQSIELHDSVPITWFPVHIDCQPRRRAVLLGNGDTPVLIFLTNNSVGHVTHMYDDDSSSSVETIMAIVRTGR